MFFSVLNSLSIWFIPFKNYCIVSNPKWMDNGKIPIADDTENLPPTQSQNPKTLVIPNLVVSYKLVLQAHIWASITFFSSKSPYSKIKLKIINKRYTFIIIKNPLFWSSCIEHRLSRGKCFTAHQKQSLTGTQSFRSFIKINRIHIGQKPQNSIFPVLTS